MGIFSQLRNRIKSQDFGMPEVLESRRRRRGIAGLFGRMRDKVPFGPVFQPEIMAPQMMRPTIFGQRFEGIPSSDIDLQNIPTLPDFSQGLPPEILERIQANIGGRYMPDFPIQPRMMMVDGDVADKEDYETSAQSLIDFLNQDPEQIAFGIEAQINELMGKYETAVRNGEMERAGYINDKINELEKMKIEVANKSIGNQAQDLRQMINEISLGTPPGGDMGSEISRGLYETDPEKVKFIQKDQGDLDQMFGGVGVKGYAGGTEVVGIAYDDGVIKISEQEVQDAIKEYKRMNRELVAAMNIPDSEIRQEVLPKLRNSKEVRLMEGGRYNPSENPNRPEMIKGYAEGDEVSKMMMELEGDQGMSASDMEGLEGLAEISGPETEMLNNIINQIIELIAGGATEEEIIQFLMEQGLDQEDITAVMSMLSQQLTAGEEEGIDSQLAALG